jgi:hypothetical protein
MVSVRELTFAWSVIFFASAAASSAYLTTARLFLEMRRWPSPSSSIGLAWAA